MEERKVQPTTKLTSPTTDSSVEREAITRRLAQSYGDYIAWIEEHYRLPREEAIQKAREDVRTPEERLEDLRSAPPDQVTWGTLQRAMEIDPDAALGVWDDLKAHAREEFDSGVSGALAMACDTPLDRARYAALRSSFIEQWQPQGGIEQALVEQLAQAQSGWLYWLHHLQEMTQFELVQMTKEEQGYGRFYGRMLTPRLSQTETVDRAMAMAERFQKTFERTLKMLQSFRPAPRSVSVNQHVYHAASNPTIAFRQG